MRIQQKVTSYKKIRKWKTGLIGQANGSKIVYLSADPNGGPFKGRFPLVCWILPNVTKLFKQCFFVFVLLKRIHCIALTRILDMTKQEQSNYTRINI